MAKKEKVIASNISRDEKLKIVADHIYTSAESWIQACVDNDNLLEEFVWRINKKHAPYNLLRPIQC